MISGLKMNQEDISKGYLQLFADRKYELPVLCNLTICERGK